MEYIISVLVKNKIGVLSLIADLFVEFGLNISSVSAGETESHKYSRITFTTEGESSSGEKLVKKLKTLSDVVNVVECLSHKRISRELAFLKVYVTGDSREEISKIINSFQTKIVDVGDNHMIVEVVENEKRIDLLLQLLISFNILEVVRSGQIAIAL